jgi:ankyrin repeat protein
MNHELINAVKSGNYALVRTLFGNGVDNPTKEQALRFAAEKGYLEIVKFLVDNGANINTSDNLPLVAAAQFGHLEVVKFLIANRPAAHAKDSNAVMASALKGHLEVVKFLVEKEFDIHAGKEQALRLSVKSGHLEIAKFLITKGADITIDNYAPLKFIIQEERVEIVKFLIERGFDIAIDNNAPLKLSAECGHTEFLKFLIERGVDIHVAKNYALTVSTRNGHLEVVKTLLEHGATPPENFAHKNLLNDPEVLAKREIALKFPNNISAHKAINQNKIKQFKDYYETFLTIKDLEDSAGAVEKFDEYCAHLREFQELKPVVLEHLMPFQEDGHMHSNILELLGSESKTDMDNLFHDC